MVGRFALLPQAIQVFRSVKRPGYSTTAHILLIIPWPLAHAAIYGYHSIIMRLGILGGGQLAQMLTQAAISFGVETVIFERSADSPAGRLTQHEIVGNWTDEALLKHFAALCDTITLENEFVDAAVLRQLEILGLPVYPTAATLSAIQDKLFQKQRCEAVGLPVPIYQVATSPADVLHLATQYGWPLLLKARRDGYDGYGNATIHGPDKLASAWEHLTRTGQALLVETFVPFRRELAVMVVRDRNGISRTYPVVETIQRNHICHIVRAPAAVSPQVAGRAVMLAQQAVEAVAGVGIFGVELFELEDGTVLLNEIAPRPHNSGHYTIEACATSQFENHIRAVLGWPLGLTEMRTPAAVMVNLLGQRHGLTSLDGIADALKEPGVYFHLYGKRETRPGRKMGHITVLDDTLAAAEARALHAAAMVTL